MPDPNIEVAQTQILELCPAAARRPGTRRPRSQPRVDGAHLYDIENINLLGAGQAYLGDPLMTTPGSEASSPTPNCGPMAPTGFQTPTTDFGCLTRPNNQYSNINMRGSNGQSTYAAFNRRSFKN